MIHTIFDLLAATACCAATALLACTRSETQTPITPGYEAHPRRRRSPRRLHLGHPEPNPHPRFGSLHPRCPRRAITAIELYKRQQKITRSMGLIFSLAFPISIAIGRIGCYQSGLQDNTLSSRRPRWPWHL
jgi:hypothetical protein